MKIFLIFLLACSTIYCEPKKVGYLHLTKDHPIDSSTVLYVKFSLDHFKKEGVGAVVLDLDTPGGEVFSALKITEMLKNLDIESKIPVYAYVNNWAISAGAMLAYSCRYIGVTSAASMGAAEPVTVSESGQMSSASEKINSALRSEFSNLANFWKRNPFIAEAMVDKDLILVSREGKILKVESEDQIKKADVIISAKGKLLTLNAVQLKEYGVADFEADTLKSYPAFQNVDWVSYHDWKIDFFAFLANPAVASFLLMGLMLGVYLEVQHPGLIFPAVGAAICLGLIGMSKFSMETINWIEIIILFLGVGLLVLEIFILPTFGFGGVVGVVLTLVGLGMFMLPHFDKVEFFPHWNLAALAIVDRLAWIALALILGAILVALTLRRMVRKFVLAGEQVVELLSLPGYGTEGKAFTDLRPSGKIIIDGHLYEAITEGLFVEKGTDITVLRQEGNRLWVNLKELS